MSRSFYKSPYASWVCYKSDKWCRQQYHRSRRRKDKNICGQLVGDVDEELGVDTYRSEEDFVNTNIDRSLRFADKYCWDSDGGKYYRGGLEDHRRDFEKQIFGSDYEYGVKHQAPWKKYKDYVELVYNKDKPLYTIVLTRVVIEKVNWGFYMPWSSEFAGKRKEEKKYITTEIYPPKYKPEEDWEMTNWWKRKNRFLSLSNWDLFGFMFKSGIIPLDFKNENELIDWLRENEESIIRKWLKAKYLRK